MDDVKIKVIDSDKLINAINEGSYDVNLSAVMALGAVMLDTKKQEICENCPSAQPTDADIQKMQDIEQAMLEKAYECGKQDAAPTMMEDGTLSITVDMDITRVKRILLNQNGTHYGELYYADDIQTLEVLPSAQPDFSCDGCQTPKHICGICMRNYPNITDHYCTGEWAERRNDDN